MASYTVVHREVRLKHRKNRREIFLRVRTQVGSGVCSFCHYSGAGSADRTPRRSFAVIVQEQDV
jgi:hypothetical protein